MYRNYKTLGTCLLLATAVTMAGCSSLMKGKRYIPPKPEEPSANIRLKNAPETSLSLSSIDENRCSAGYTPVPTANGFFDTQVPTGEELVLSYTRKSGDKVCHAPFSFVPEQGATYTVETGSWSGPEQTFLLSTYQKEYCGVRVTKNKDQQQSIEPIQQLKLRPGFCLKFVKTD